MSAIQDQVKLPISVALEVVLQGIRIRLGRSIVTITGVICGIAFLMSILTGQLIKQGVSAEDAIRDEVQRINNFMKAELPSLTGKTITLLATGNLSEAEIRVLEDLADAGVTSIESGKDTALLLSRPLPILSTSATETINPESALVLIMGSGQFPERDWAALLSSTPLASTIPTETTLSLPKGQFIKLSRELTEEEVAKKEANIEKGKFRSIWIGIISLLVTVIGITNAMLMSVTERFREIGTMKCLGALSAFIRQIFLLESSMMGLTGGVIGAILGALFSFLAYTLSYGFALVAGSLSFLPLLAFAAGSVIVGVVLSMVAALYPAQVASNMVPAHALRSNV